MCWISCRIKEIDRKQVLKRGRNPTPDTTVPSTLLNAKEKINLALPPRLNAHAPSSPESPTPSYTSQKSSCESVLLLAPILSPHLVQEGHLLTIPAYFPSLTTQIYLNPSLTKHSYTRSIGLCTSSAMGAGSINGVKSLGSLCGVSPSSLLCERPWAENKISPRRNGITFSFAPLRRRVRNAL